MGWARPRPTAKTVAEMYEKGRNYNINAAEETGTTAIE